MEFGELVAFLRAQLARAALTLPDGDGVLLVDKPRRRHLARRGRRGRRAAAARDEVGHAGTLDPFATGLLLVLDRARDARPALPDGAAQALRDRGAAGLHVDHRRPRGRDRAGADAGRAARAPDRADPPAAARLLRRARRRASARTRSRAPARRSRCPSARSTCTRFEQLWRDGERAAFAIECGSGTYVRSLIADLGDAYCLELRRTADRPVRRRRRRPLRRRSARRSASCRRSSWPATTPAGRGTAWRSPRAAHARRSDRAARRRRRA